MPRLDSGLGDPRHRNGCLKSFAMPLRGNGWRAMRLLRCRDRGDGATGVLAMQRCLCGVYFASIPAGHSRGLLGRNAVAKRFYIAG